MAAFAARRRLADSLGMDAPATPPPLPGLDPAQTAILSQSAQSYRAILKAARTASMSGGTTLCIGAAAGVFACFSPDIGSFLAAAALVAIGLIELGGARRLRRADPAAPRRLMLNQLVFLGLIAIYCLVKIVAFSPAAAQAAALPDDVRSQLGAAPELEKMIDGQIDTWGRLANTGFYVLLLVLSILFQGGLALYYRRRQKFVTAFRQSTPAWAQDVVVRMSS